MLYIIIPSFNEGSVLLDTLKCASEITKNIILVDDCSTDATISAVESELPHVVVVSHLINLGQGAALQTGIEVALSMGATSFCTFDADGQHNHNDILPMLDELESSKADIILGSRFLGKTHNLPSSRKLILKLAIIFTKITSGGSFSDVHNGLRVFNSKFAKEFRFEQNRMSHASEILYYIAKNNVPFSEYPTTITYNDYTLEKGQSGLNSINIVAELILGKISK